MQVRSAHVDPKDAGDMVDVSFHPFLDVRLAQRSMLNFVGLALSLVKPEVVLNLNLGG